MKINLNQNELEKCNQLLIAKDINMSSAEFYIEYLTEHSLDITKNDIEKLTKKFSLEESFYRSIKRKMNIFDDDEEFNTIDKQCNIKNLHKLKASNYLSNPFYKNIPVTNQKLGKWQLTKLKYHPYEGFVYDELDIQKERNYSEHTPLGFFDEEFPYLAIIQDNEIWMSVIPHEINTMKKAINNAYGDVLVLGLGIGYFPYMISLKEDVSSITIIETDKNAIELFEEWIYPYFPNKDKIKIINIDAFDYLDNTDSNLYDYAFMDIWHNAGDGISLYLKLKKYELKNNRMAVDYWIEKSLLAMMRREILTIFEEQLDGSKEEDYLKAIDENDRIINSLYFFTKETPINSYNDLLQLLDDNSLKEIAKNLNYK